MSLDFDAGRPVVGMVHLDALPGAPGFDGDREAIRDAMLRDARRLESGGVDALMLENFGDAPFYADDVPKHVVASMAALAADLRRETNLPSASTYSGTTPTPPSPSRPRPARSSCA